MRHRSIVLAIAGLTLAVGCHKKSAKEGATAGTGSGSAATSGSGTGAAGTPTVQTAEGGAIGDLPVVNDCPKSLSGGEKVARTIKKACGPIHVTSSYSVDGTLTLEAGVVLLFAPGSQLSVGYSGPAKLIVQGGDAADQRVVFSSAGDKAPGVWKGVTLYDGADRSQITGLDIEFAGEDGGAALSLRKASDVIYTKSSIKHAKDQGLSTQEGSTFAQFTGNTFDDIGKVAMFVDPPTVGTLGTGNTFGKDEYVLIRGGQVKNDATWKNIGAPYRAADSISIEGSSVATTLTLADITIAFPAGAELSVGYNSHAKLIVTGPATLGGTDAKPGAWKGIIVYRDGDASIDNATLTNGGDDSTGVLHAKDGGKLTLGAVTFKDNATGLGVDENTTFSAAKPLTFTGNARAARLRANAFGGLGDANVYADGQLIEITGGDLHADATWRLQPKAVVHVLDSISVGDNHTLTITAGSSYAFQAKTELSIGYNSTGTLKIAGTAAAPVAFSAIAKDDTWEGVKLYGNARATDLAYLNLASVGGDGGVIAKQGAIGKIDHVSCAGCSATFVPECGAKVDGTAVTAGANTKVGAKKPDGC